MIRFAQNLPVPDVKSLQRHTEPPVITFHRMVFAFLHNDWIALLNASCILSVTLLFVLMSGAHSGSTNA
ncbi:hypothetical protein SAMN04488109_6159 [Chryseolinea serpens]|uniref:Uncharacterized protein n=1 Tax=Chryseolinea serpens TaxID=947013 RepID=A0A1M5WYI0_9BACT|nr:hypothetical protein SAMN04488109_6159 [Chryseolinea serpens]